MDISSFECLALGKRAANAYLEAGEPLTASLAKIAEERCFTQLQIQRVLECANHEVNEVLRKQADDKTFCFDVATLDGVLAELQGTEAGIPKIAAADIRIDIKSYIGRDSKEHLFDAMAKEAHLSAPRAEVRVKKLIDAAVKVAENIEAARQDSIAKLAGLKEDIRQGINRLTDIAINHVGNNNDLDDMKKFACSAFPDDGPIWDALFDEVKNRAMAKMATFSPLRMKLAAETLTGASEVKPTMINGRHSLQIELDTLRNKISETDQYAKRVRLLDTMGPAVVKGIREFKDSKDVDDYLLNHVYMARDVTNDKVAFYHALDSGHDKLAAGYDKLFGLKGAGGDDLRSIALMALLNQQAVKRPYDLAAHLSGEKEDRIRAF